MLSLSSHADVLRASSRVPAAAMHAPVSGAGTRDEPLRKSVGEAIQSLAVVFTS